MIIVTGATGRLGSQIVDQLLRHFPADNVGVSVRDIDSATSLAERGVRVRAGDFTEPSSLDAAFEGADQVLIVSAAIRGSRASAANCAAIDAAVRAGASRVLYTSHQAASVTSLFPPQLQHAATETHLAEQNIAYTSLRHGFYASSLEFYVSAALQTGELRLPRDGPVSWTARADLAEMDAIALTRPASISGITPPLTASEALDFADLANILSDIVGHRIARVLVEDEQWKQIAIEGGMPRIAADYSLGMFRAARNGEFNVIDPTLETLLGRKAITAQTALERIVDGLPK
jgi:NAD(P)H dehydrogenase (quinone)